MSVYIFGHDVYTLITLFLYNHNDLKSLSCVNKSNYNYIYQHDSILLYRSYFDLNITKLKKLTAECSYIYNIPTTDILILNECDISNLIIFNNTKAIQIQNSYVLYASLSFTKYDNIIAIHLENHIIDPDDLVLPNLEYLYVNDYDRNDEYVLIFDVERFPKLKYLDLNNIYFNKTECRMLFLEYINSVDIYHDTPNLLYMEWPRDKQLLNEEEYINLFPKLNTLITFAKPVHPFNKIKLITPDKSNIAFYYYNMYFNVH